MMIDLKDLSNEEELVILEEGLRSRFWDVLQARWGHLAFTAAGVALNESKIATAIGGVAKLPG